MKIDHSCDSIRAGLTGRPPVYAEVCIKCRRPGDRCKQIALHQLAGYLVFISLFTRVRHYRTGRIGQLRFIGRFDEERADWPCIVRYAVKDGGTQDRASTALTSFRPAGRRKPRTDKELRRTTGRQVTRRT